MRKVLVTGGCGFIGSNFIRYLLATDPSLTIINLDCLTYAGNPANLADVAHLERYHFEQGDILDTCAVRGILDQGVDSILHFAAHSHVDRSIQDSHPFVRVNVLGTQVLLDLALTYGISRFVHISTDEVYGSLGPSGAFTEDAPLAPNNPYAASKAAADMLVRSFVQTYHLPALITRSSNNYGPYQYPEKLIPRFVMHLLQDEPVPIYGDGLQVRDWLHVLDHCRAIDRVWRHGRVGEIYNIGGGCEWTNLRLAHFLLRLLDKPASLLRFVKDRPGHDRRYSLNCNKMATELNWRPTVPFDDGLEETVRWYQQHQDWIAKSRLNRLAGSRRRPRERVSV